MNQFRNFGLALICLVTSFLYGPCSLSAQDLIPEDNRLHAYFSNEAYTEVKIAADTKMLGILLAVKAGDGGTNIDRGSTKLKGGGVGTYVRAWFAIGNDPDMIQPGSTLRLIPGKHGKNARELGDGGAGCGGGGGGSAILLLEPGQTDWNRSTILMVAGGGGGGGEDYPGRPGSTTEVGTAGLGRAGAPLSNAGVIGGPGIGNLFATGGGSAKQLAYSTFKSECAPRNAAKPGYPNGGKGSDTGLGSSCTVAYGGWGFGGGGAGDDAGGGGGGYSGGSAGKKEDAGYNDQGQYEEEGSGGGGGGGSYINPAYSFQDSQIMAAGATSAPRNGYVLYGYSKDATIHLAKNSNKCIDVGDETIHAGSNVQLYDCRGDGTQSWLFDGQMIRFIRDPERCLEIQGSNPYNGANVELWTCNSGTDAQKWFYDGINHQIRSVKNYNKCLDLAGGKTDNKTNLQIWDCKSIETQQWLMEDPSSVLAKDREQTIHSGLEVNKCIHTRDDWMGKGAWLELWDCQGSTAQQWMMDGLQIKAVNNSNRCVTIENASEENGSQILLWDCHNDAHQQWIYDGVKRLIRSKKNLNKCLALSTNSAGNGTTIQLKNCSTNETQQWYLDYAATSPTDDPVQTIRPAYASEKCFHTQQGSTANGANVELWDCLGTAAQEWYFNGSSIKSNVNKNKCLDLLNHSTTNGSNIAMWECNEGTNQQWIYDGLTKSIRSGQDPSKCIHIKAGSSDNGANVELWDCLGTVGQQFEVK